MISAGASVVYGLLLLQNSAKGAYLVSCLDPEVAERYMWLQIRSIPGTLRAALERLHRLPIPQVTALLYDVALARFTTKLKPERGTSVA